MAKTVLITGAAHGLGNALARKFLQEGWHLIATDLDDLSLAWLPEEKAMALNMDVTSDESVLEAFKKVSARGLTIDLVINNAGIDRYFPLSEAPVSRFREVFEVNLFGAYRVNQVFLPLVKRPGGRIIHIGSESLNLTVPFMTYPLTKRALEGYAKALRIELRFAGIDVVVIRPGAIRTNLLQTVSTLDPDREPWNLQEPFRRFAASASKEIGKTISPEEAAEFIFKVAGIHRPAAVYRINNMWKLRVAGWLPFGWVEQGVWRMLRG